MKNEMRAIIQDIYCDLEAACAECGEALDAESLADAVGDRMHDTSEEYRAMPWEQRHALTMSVCSEYC